MANVQKYFTHFNKVIRLGHFEENETLREKRDIIRDKLTKRLPEVFENEGEPCPKFYFRNQGSYEMGTGVRPLENDYDIDQGLYFDVSIEQYPNPVTLKQRVHSALDGHTDNVCIRRSCVTAFYHQDGESIFHVDIAVYSDGACSTDGKSRIAKGKENSEEQYRVWDVSNPQALIDKILGRFTDENDRHQFRRVVRYLKRWKDVNFSSDGNGAPIGIGLTAAAYYYIENSYIDIVSRIPNDLAALRSVVGQMTGRFTPVPDSTEYPTPKRIAVDLPVEPWNDLFEKMTLNQMSIFEQKLNALQDILDDAINEIDPVKACELLKKAFGEDFPIPPKDETAKRHPPAISSSSNSA